MNYDKLRIIKEELQRTRPPSHLNHKHTTTLEDYSVPEQEENIIQEEKSSEERIELALKALNLGGDPIEICKLLNWREFENLSVEAFQLNGYSVIDNLTFSSNKKRFQMDVIASKNNSILSIDCKHWMYFYWFSRIKDAVKTHLNRTKALSNEIQILSSKLSLKSSKKIFIVPVIVTLSDPRRNIIEGVPIVSILKLEDFIFRMPYIPDSGFKYYTTNLIRLDD
ncbi:MAG: hypothetical protein NWF08_09625 [Candidatus Bathyarchaeota archaeon]|nr:hypothetical protein [Candidatus Bathyarchaeota archaeon]